MNLPQEFFRTDIFLQFINMEDGVETPTRRQIHPILEMFLDITDLSKTVDRHGIERCHVLSRSSRFWQPFVLDGSLFFQTMVENGNIRH